MWEHRNGALFDEKDNILKELQFQEIEQQFEIGFLGFPRHMRQQVSKTITEVKELDVNERTIWIAHIQAVRNRACETQAVRERRILDAQQRLMNRFFRPGNA